MAFRYNEPVEIFKKQEQQQGHNIFLGSYWKATLLAAVGINRYIVRYYNRSTEDRTRPLTEVVDATEVRPLPPNVNMTHFSVSHKVDAYLNGAWRVGTVLKNEHPNYTLRMYVDGNEVSCRFDKIRIHLDWEDGKWVYHRPENI